MIQVNRLRYAWYRLRELWFRVPTHSHKRQAAVEGRIGVQR